jgi:hypothetical protein
MRYWEVYAPSDASVCELLLFQSWLFLLLARFKFYPFFYFVFCFYLYVSLQWVQSSSTCFDEFEFDEPFV